MSSIILKCTKLLAGDLNTETRWESLRCSAGLASRILAIVQMSARSSVRLSVCLSVRHTFDLYQNGAIWDYKKTSL